MPELPEVETIARELRPGLTGRRFESAEVTWARTIAAPGVADFLALLPGRQVIDVGRRGKFLLFKLDPAATLAVHLRMTGRLEIVPCDSPIAFGPHVRARFRLVGGECLVFTDARKFGRIWLVQDEDQLLGALGPEPLGSDFTPQALAERLGRRRGAIKALLLDQSVVAGVGNIYADEALFESGIHPLRPGASLTLDEVARLHAAIRQVLAEAIGDRGTTLRDYRPPYGAEGAYQNSLRVYQQTGRPCPRCTTPVQRIRVTQRGTHYCPHCQPEKGLAHIILLHSNDVHGRVEGLARLAALVERVRADNPQASILYFDAGDVEEPSQRLSNLTKGAGMHRLLSVAGCDAAVAGNGAWLRYGPQVLESHAAAARYPLLLANLRTQAGELLPGAQMTAMLDLAGLRLGLIGVTTEISEGLATYFGLSSVPVLPLVQGLAADLRRAGADGVVVLSHLGLAGDRELARGLQEAVELIIGGHSHDLLPGGERVGSVTIAQAGYYAEHLGWVDLAWDGRRLWVEGAKALAVEAGLEPSLAVLAEAEAVEAEIGHYLDEIIGELAEPLDFALDRECGVGDLMADALRERMGAEVALVPAGAALTGPLPAGPLRRGVLWDVCSSTANPGAVVMSGLRLVELLTKGQEPEFVAGQPPQLRGQARGLLHLSGATLHDGQLRVGDLPVDPERTYVVAATDWELEPYGGYADPGWRLQPSYEVPTILREVLEDYLVCHRPLRVPLARLGETGS